MIENAPKVKGFLLRLPFSLRQRARELANQDGQSLNHFISMAVAEKIVRMEALEKPAITQLPPRRPQF